MSSKYLVFLKDASCFVNWICLFITFWGRKRISHVYTGTFVRYDLHYCYVATLHELVFGIMNVFLGVKMFNVAFIVFD